MRRTIGIALVLASCGFFIAAFQNCSVYKSSDKTSFEGSGAPAPRSYAVAAKGASIAAFPAPRAASASANSTKGSTVGYCQRLLADGAADAAFGQPTEQAEIAEADGSPACMISTYANVADGSDTAICSASTANLALLEAVPGDENRIIADPDPSGPLSGGSFGFAHELADGRVEFIFVGSLTGAKDAIACRFAFQSRQGVESALSKVASRGSILARAYRHR
jgi:hypothetical protein